MVGEVGTNECPDMRYSHDGKGAIFVSGSCHISFFFSPTQSEFDKSCPVGPLSILASIAGDMQRSSCVGVGPSTDQKIGWLTHELGGATASETENKVSIWQRRILMTIRLTYLVTQVVDIMPNVCEGRRVCRSSCGAYGTIF